MDIEGEKQDGIEQEEKWNEILKFGQKLQSLYGHTSQQHLEQLTVSCNKKTH
ncbi:hypothetical protein HK096_005296 [Nowakowskiella sp. JEL0078]|nr:hypothetical protein HK096_005296 [Nowakowskiella sp. JEL0078]